MTKTIRIKSNRGCTCEAFPFCEHKVSKRYMVTVDDGSTTTHTVVVRARDAEQAVDAALQVLGLSDYKKAIVFTFAEAVGS